MPSLYIGGSERVIVHLVRNLSRTVFDINLLVLNKQGELLSELPSDISIQYFYFKRTIFSIFRIFSLLRKRQPDIVFTTLGQLNLLASIIRPFINKRVIFVARESSIVSLRNKDDKYPAIFRFLLRYFYFRLDFIVSQSNAMKMDLITHTKIPSEKIFVIHNPIDIAQLKKAAPVKKWNTENRALLSIGQLRPEKGYERLIRAISGLKCSYAYHIIGGGDLEKNLRSLVKQLALTDNVKFLGAISNPYGYLQNADCLLLGSYYEGFPNVVIEANALGVPVVAWASPGGHNEIIINGFNGWLVNNEDELVSIIENKRYLNLDSHKIISHTILKYDIRKVIGEYEKLFLNLRENLGVN
ncbi:MAG: glycosyltransferase [Cyclobacteriaceae bacterium]